MDRCVVCGLRYDLLRYNLRGSRRDRHDRERGACERGTRGEELDAMKASLHGIKCNLSSLRIDVSPSEWNLRAAVIPALCQQQLVYRKPAGGETVRRSGHVQTPDSVDLLSH
jgi:hypothetical protein